ncbi:hypothetical protein [Geobacillus sp. LEMMY01]|uniref:hypothetical protein n=1 Tax=Geobacillus sp. LEMMY01 TaxID=1954237 RepID=UPI0015921F17|nr:hypothetical protein [Geobacillus sp. LEMMY01]
MDDNFKKISQSQQNIKKVFEDLNLSDRLKFTYPESLTNYQISDQFNATVNRMREIQQRLAEQKEREKQEELEYRKAVLSALQGIEKNTAFLSEVTLLLQKNIENQDELFQLLVEIMEIMKSKTNEEAESKYRKIMRKIGEFTADIGTIQTLYLTFRTLNKNSK